MKLDTIIMRTERLPWLHIVDAVACDPEPLYPLKYRARSIASLALTDKSMYAEVMEYAKHRLVQHHVSKEAKEAVLSLKNADLRIACDVDVSMMASSNGLRVSESHETQGDMPMVGTYSYYKRTRCSVLRHQQATQHLTDSEMLRVQLMRDRNELIGKGDASKAYLLEAKDMIGCSLSSNTRSLLLEEVKMAALRKHGSYTALVELRRKVEASRIRRRENVQNRERRTTEALVQGQHALTDMLRVMKDRLEHFGVDTPCVDAVLEDYGGQLALQNQVLSGHPKAMRAFNRYVHCGSDKSYKMLREAHVKWDRETHERVEYIIQSFPFVQEFYELNGFFRGSWKINESRSFAYTSARYVVFGSDVAYGLLQQAAHAYESFAQGWPCDAIYAPSADNVNMWKTEIAAFRLRTAAVLTSRLRSAEGIMGHASAVKNTSTMLAEAAVSFTVIKACLNLDNLHPLYFTAKDVATHVVSMVETLYAVHENRTFVLSQPPRNKTALETMCRNVFVNMVNCRMRQILPCLRPEGSSVLERSSSFSFVVSKVQESAEDLLVMRPAEAFDALSRTLERQEEHTGDLDRFSCGDGWKRRRLETSSTSA